LYCSKSEILSLLWLTGCRTLNTNHKKHLLSLFFMFIHECVFSIHLGSLTLWQSAIAYLWLYLRIFIFIESDLSHFHSVSLCCYRLSDIHIPLLSMLSIDDETFSSISFSYRTLLYMRL
jgi:hypothetical protein